MFDLHFMTKISIVINFEAHNIEGHWHLTLVPDGKYATEDVYTSRC